MRSIAEGEESFHFYHQKMKVIEKVMALIWGGWNEYSVMEDVGDNMINANGCSPLSIESWLLALLH